MGNQIWTAGRDASKNPPGTLTLLGTFFCTIGGNYYFQNQSATQLQLVLDDPDNAAAGSTILLVDPAGANAQGGDSQPPIPFFTGRIQVYGTAGAQFAGRVR